MRHLCWIVFALVLLAALGCGKADKEAMGWAAADASADDVDEDSDGVIDGVPAQVNDIFTVAELQALVDNGLPVFVGEEPPLVEGRYLADQLTILFDSLGGQGTLPLYAFVFSNQTDDFTAQLDYSDDAGQDVAPGNLTYVAGADGCFTLFGNVSGTDSTITCDYTRATVISGCMDGVNYENGVANLSFAFIVRTLGDACQNPLPVGALRILVEADGLATRHQ